MSTEPVVDYGTCGCGEAADKISSGSPECWPCWYWRKMNGPAARHWVEVSEQFLSNVDTWDLTNFLPAAGLSNDEITCMLVSTRKLLDYCKDEIERHKR